MKVSAPLLSIARNPRGMVALVPSSFISTTSPSQNEWFDAFARKASLLCGKPVVFMGAAAIVLLWAVTGPLFGFSDTWQLVINTGTTIVTFLMVFLIQNTQNRDAMAVQIKLAELIIAVKGAQNSLANAEDLSEEDLERLHDEYRQKAASANEVLATRRKSHKGSGARVNIISANTGAFSLAQSPKWWPEGERHCAPSTTTRAKPRASFDVV